MCVCVCVCVCVFVYIYIYIHVHISGLTVPGSWRPVHSFSHFPTQAADAPLSAAESCPPTPAGPYRSDAVQFAVAVAERLDAAERKERGNRVRCAF